MKTKTYMIYEWGMHGTGIFNPYKIKELSNDTKIDFKFSCDATIDYTVLLDEIIEQLEKHNINIISSNSEDDVEIEIELKE